MTEPDWLPPLIRLTDYGGDWNRYVEAVYAVFQKDFIENGARFKGKPVRLGSQVIDGKQRTFWHVTSEGNVEENRTPDIRRCERIGWLRAMIDHEGDDAVLSWPQSRGRKQRHVLWLKDSNFAIVLEKRPHGWWLWTAYPTDRPHTQKKLWREYDNWKKANAAR